MSWAEVKKINSNLDTPLDKLLTTSGREVFTTSGIFTVPTDVRNINITACAGGGGGGLASKVGTSGGVTIIGSLVTLPGGSGGGSGSAGGGGGAGSGSGGSGGTRGLNGNDGAPIDGIYRGGRGGYAATGGGGGGSLGNGGNGVSGGMLGGGGGGQASAPAGGGGGGGDFIISQRYTVTPGEQINITVGSGGSGSAWGGSGIVVIEWGLVV